MDATTTKNLQAIDRQMKLLGQLYKRLRVAAGAYLAYASVGDGNTGGVSFSHRELQDSLQAFETALQNLATRVYDREVNETSDAA